MVAFSPFVSFAMSLCKPTARKRTAIGLIVVAISVFASTHAPSVTPMVSTMPASRARTSTWLMENQRCVSCPPSPFSVSRRKSALTPSREAALTMWS